MRTPVESLGSQSVFSFLLHDHRVCPLVLDLSRKATPTGEESSSSSTSYQQSLCGVAVAALVAAVWARRRQLRTSDSAARESLLEMEHTANNDTAQGTRTVV